MSTPDELTAAPTAATARKRSPMRLALFALPVVALAGGGAYAYTAGLLPFGARPGASAPAGPQQVLEADSTPQHPHYKTSYLKIEGAFTTNLEGSPRFVQVEIGVATTYDATILAHVQTHELPIRSAVLGVLAEQSESAIGTPGGRAALQRQLKAAINHVLVLKEGFGGVSDVYLTGLVVQ